MASSITTPKTLITKSLSKPYFSSSSSSQLPFKFCNRATASSSISCSYTPNSATVHMVVLPRPDSFGRFGKYGGKYVPETLTHTLTELETAFHALAHDEEFEMELNEILRDYVGRETPLYFAQRLTEHYQSSNGEGPHIYLKREDLNHTGAHKINNVVGQALLAKRGWARNVLLLRPEQVNMELPLPRFVLGLG